MLSVKASLFFILALALPNYSFAEFPLNRSMAKEEKKQILNEAKSKLSPQMMSIIESIPATSDDQIKELMLAPYNSEQVSFFSFARIQAFVSNDFDCAEEQETFTP